MLIIIGMLSLITLRFTHIPEFQSFINVFFHLFVLIKLATSSIRVNFNRQKLIWPLGFKIKKQLNPCVYNSIFLKICARICILRHYRVKYGEIKIEKEKKSFSKLPAAKS